VMIRGVYLGDEICIVKNLLLHYIVKTHI